MTSCERSRFDSFDDAARTRFLDSELKNSSDPTRNPWDGAKRRNCAIESPFVAMERASMETRDAIVESLRRRDGSFELDADWR